MSDQEIEKKFLPVSPTATQILVPKTPDGFSAEALQKVEKEVVEFAAKTAASLDNRNFTMTLENLGRPSQDLAAKNIELIETRINLIVKVEKGEKDIPGAVTEMRKAIDRLNPRRAEQSNVGKLLTKFPGGRQVFDLWLASGIRQIAMKRETIREQIKGIQNGLLGNRSMLLADNVQLNQVYSYIVESALSNIQRDAYFCELLLEKLLDMQTAMAPDDPRRIKLQRAIEMITVRIRNMRLTENALQQSLASIDITIDGNRKIAESMEETAILTTNYLTEAMALYQALAHQQNAIRALIKARAGTTDVMLKTSEMVKASAEDVSKLYFNPAEELAKFEQTQANLMSALQTLENASREGTVQARQSIIKLSGMTQDLKKKQAELRAGNELSKATQ